MRAIKRVAFVVGGGLAGGLLVWLYLLVFAPGTSIDDAIGIMLIGLGVGCIVACACILAINFKGRGGR